MLMFGIPRMIHDRTEIKRNTIKRQKTTTTKDVIFFHAITIRVLCDKRAVCFDTDIADQNFVFSRELLHNVTTVEPFETILEHQPFYKPESKILL